MGTPVVARRPTHLKGNDFIKKSGDFIFPSSEIHRGKYIGGKTIIDCWKKMCKMLNFPKQEYPMAHSGHDCLLLLAVAQKRPREEILDATQWSNISSLAHYVGGPIENNITQMLATNTVENLDASTINLRSFNENCNN